MTGFMQTFILDFNHYQNALLATHLVMAVLI